MKKVLLPIAPLGGIAFAALAAETPKVGEKAPTVEVLDQDGKIWKLADQLGKQVVLIYLYPKDETPSCTKQACGFRDQLGDLNKAGVTVVGVSRDDAESHKKFRANQNLNFPLLVDTAGKLTEAFGAGTPDRPRSRRVSFLIGRDGKIIHVTDNRDATVHLEEIKQAVEKLNRKP